MKNGVKIFGYIAAFVFGAILFHNKPETNTPKIVIKKDTIIHHDTSYVPKIIHIYHTIHFIDTIIIPQKTDTAAILADYFRKRFYADTLANDTNAYVAIYDTVQFNRITNRRRTIRIYPHTKIITIHQPPTWHLYAGAGIGGNANTLFQFQYGSIKRNFIFSFLMISLLFQFQYGSIKSVIRDPVNRYDD